ncbi:uncharacterized protein LOC143035963 [Oratosquilla oratoria]|uniref:uncharacterized protein LOC143035963 n=1 Tax=Oratosquilla oratoria TaxID=337810 RepID=UPI003F76CD23
MLAKSSWHLGCMHSARRLRQHFGEKRRRNLWTRQDPLGVTPPLKYEESKTSKEPLRKVEAREDLEDVLVSLKAHFPLSSRIHNILLLKLRGLEYHDIYVPEDGKNKHRLVLYKIKDREEFGVFCTPEDSDFFKENLIKTSIIDFSKRVSSCYTLYYLKEAAREVLETRSGKEVQEDTTKYLCIMNNDEILQWKESLGASTLGTVRPLDVAGMTKCHQMWPFRDSTPLQVFLDIAKIAPTAGFYLHEDPSRLKDTSEMVQSSEGGDGVGLPVAMISVTHNGTIGMLHTEREHRGLGIASFMGMACAKQMVMEGYEAIATVDRYNTAWQAQALRNGYQFDHEVVGMSVLGRS